MTVIRRAMVSEATCHDLTPASLNSMHPQNVDAQHRAWIKDVIHARTVGAISGLMPVTSSGATTAPSPRSERSPHMKVSWVSPSH